MIELLNMDCMDYMREQPDKSFDLCITSPQYNMNLRVNSKGDGYCSRQIVKEISSKYHNNSDNLTMNEYKQFLSDFIKESTRVCELVFLNIQQITGNKPAIFQAIGENSKLLKETIIWDKITTSPAVNERTLSSVFEYIFVFGGNPIARQFKKTNFARGTLSNLWKIPARNTSAKNHGAGFPLALPEKILQEFANTRDRVLDPFVGTGTTAIAAHYFGVDFVGIEIDEDYYNAARDRFDKETAQEALF